VDTIHVLALALSRLGEVQEPADLLEGAIECLRQRVGVDHPVFLGTLSDALPFLDRAGRWPDGERCARELRMLSERNSAHGDLTFLPDMYIALFVSRQGRLDEAEALFQALLLREHDDPSDLLRARLHVWYANHLTACGQFAQAEDHLRLAVQRIGDVETGTSTTHPDDVVLGFISLYEAWGKADDAEAYRRLRVDVVAAPFAQ
jgi:tetratricopeptide (TPR) repeat protein